MILKHIHRSGRWPEFRVGCKTREDCVRLLAYLLRPQAEPEVLRNDFAGDTPVEIAEQLALVHRKQKYWAYHVVASHPHDERPLWDPQARRRIGELQTSLRIPQGFWVRHGNHWHGFLTAMNERGGTVRLCGVDADGQQVPVARHLRLMAERWEDGTPSAKKTGRDEHNLNLSRDSLAMAERLHVAGQTPSPAPKKLLLKARVERAVSLARSMEDMLQLAKDDGIEVHLKRDAAGAVLGISFACDGVSLRGRDAGFSYQKLLSHYEHPDPENPIIAERRRSHRMAGRTRGIHRRKGPSRPPTGARQANRHLGADPSIPRDADRHHDRQLGWPESAFRALKPKTDLVDLLLQFAEGIARVCRQSDFRLRSHRHEINKDPIPL